MSPMTRALLVACALLAGTQIASAACPDKRASCVLHEEGVALFIDKKFDLAAAKFAASIAAEPTARSYLGYAQAVEGLGQLALAYDSLAIAQRLSTQEVTASGGKDVDINARAERIKYKLGEMRAKIGFVWLRVPPGVSPSRVVSVQRRGEGDLPKPLEQWTTVVPGRQVLVASLDDGSRIEVVANVTAGGQSVIVIPIRTASAAKPPVAGRPIAAIYEQPPKKPDPIYNTYLAITGSVLAPGPADTSAGSGLGVLYERRLSRTFGLVTRLDLLAHPEKALNNVPPQSTKGFEVLALLGMRTMGRSFHGRAELGTAILSRKLDDGIRSLPYDRVYPVVALGGGVQLGRFRLHAGVMVPINAGAELEMPVRFFGSLGVDLIRR
jgi:hypothetical protein